MSPFSSDPALPWLRWLQQSQAAFDALPPDDDYGLYELLRLQASCVVPVDSCYFCLYRATDETLFFVYNFDGQIYDEPLTLPVGDGPTSWVVKHGAAFVLSEHTESVQHGNVQFGHHERFSNSAIHLPIGVRAAGAPSDGAYSEIFGVFSIQSYQFDAYDKPTVAALQLLCDYVALHIQRKRERVESQRKQSELTEKFKSQEAYKIRMANHFVELLQPLARQIQTLSHQLTHEAPSISQLRGQTLGLSRLCSRLQTEVCQLPMDIRPLPLANGVSSAALALDEDNPLRSLSEREFEVLRMAATGSSNDQISEALTCSINTVKKHCTHIYSKLGVKGRTNAIHFYNRYAGSAKFTLSDKVK